VLDPTTTVIPFADWSVDDPEAVTLVDVDRPADLPDPG
jgi:hypothetical protein